ncbi:MAG TPA: hypothetical protein VG649_00525 [Candidatus Angelobacter sp.]|nr:hypothetical protein [Candidatus Angelobacter sp.]
MIRNYKNSLAMLTIMVSLLIAMASGQVKQKKTSSPTKAIQGMGCVGPGVEERCILLTDATTHTLYNLYFKGKGPLLGSTIQFTGKKHNGPTTCMQGQPVDVTKWTKLDNSCSAR